MRPNNEIGRVQLTEVDVMIVNNMIARFGINLVEHPELRQQETVKRCLDEFAEAYPVVQGWAAKISGNTLIIDVHGVIDPKYYGM